MKNQRNQLIALAVLLILWAISWRLTRIPPPPPSEIKTTAAAKSTQQDSLLKTRFHRVRSEMDSLYHYRIKPAPFVTHGNPFRISGVVPASQGEGVGSQSLRASSAGAIVASPSDVPERGEALLRHAIELARIGGVVTMGGTTMLTVDGQLHKEGEVFTTKVKAVQVLIRIKHLSTSFVTLALDDPAAGSAEAKVRLK